MHLCWTALIYHPNMQSETICDCTAPPQNSFQLISAGVFGRRQRRPVASREARPSTPFFSLWSLAALLRSSLAGTASPTRSPRLYETPVPPEVLEPVPTAITRNILTWSPLRLGGGFGRSSRSAVAGWIACPRSLSEY
jgi:hypothetical protein